MVDCIVYMNIHCAVPNGYDGRVLRDCNRSRTPIAILYTFIPLYDVFESIFVLLT